MPRPVELPMPKRRRSPGSIAAARPGARASAIASTMSITKARISQTVSISAWKGAMSSGRSWIASRSAAPNLPEP